MIKRETDAPTAGISLRKVTEWCGRGSGAHTESADSQLGHRSDPLVSRYLAARGIPEHEPLEAYGIGSFGIADLRAYEWTTLIPREKLIEQVRCALLQNGLVALTGAVRSGKSQLSQMLLADPEVQARYPRSIVLDGMALRGRSYQALNREAIFYLCTETIERDRYLSPAVSGPVAATLADPTGDAKAEDPADTALSRYFHSGVIEYGLLLVEHAERIAPGPESERWLAMILEEARVHRAHVIVVCAAGHDSNIPHRRILGGLPRLIVPDLTREEIAAGLKREYLRSYVTTGMTAGRVHRMSGGRPGIIRDLLRFLVTECAGRNLSGRNVLRAFVRRQTACYSVECQYLVEVLRNRPDSLLDPLRRASNGLLTRALTSGAIVKTANHFAFSAPIIARRYRELSRPENLLWMASSGKPEVILTRSGFPELIGDSLANVIRATASPAMAFARYAEILRHFGLRNIEIHIRDRDNACLWSRIFTEDPDDPVMSEEWRPLVAENEAEFARAARTGRRVMDMKEQIWLPSSGLRGHVEVLTKGRLSENPHTYSGRLKIRVLWNIVLTLESALATAAERLLLKRQLRMSLRAHYRMQATGSADTPSRSLLDGFLQQANCNAVAVLERAGPFWRVADLRGIRVGDYTDWAALLADANGGRLDEIATHPSGRGLVLGETELVRVFPHLFWRKKSVAMSVNPVRAAGDNELKLVAFIFVGTRAHDISGARQKHLFLMAPILMTPNIS